jgi:3-oxoacyl-[acyl-carrier-protein] synthase-3
VAPIPPPGWSSATAVSGSERVQDHFGKDPRRLREFGERLNERIVEVIDRACARAGLSRDQVTRVIYINDPDGIDDIAQTMSLPIERTNKALSIRHGHMGAADQLIALSEHLERGELGPGDVVALTGISIGMRWYCTLIRI